MTTCVCGHPHQEPCWCGCESFEADDGRTGYTLHEDGPWAIFCAGERSQD